MLSEALAAGTEKTFGSWTPTLGGFMKHQEDGSITLLSRNESKRWVFHHLVQGRAVAGDKAAYANKNIAAIRADIHHATHSGSWLTPCC